MDIFNKKVLYTAMAATGLLAASGAAHAVNVNADGLGQVLIYPYYTVNQNIIGNAYNTYISIVNSTNSMKSVKVRFREGKNSQEVLDFNVFLSHQDMWTASIVPTAVGDGAAIVTQDVSCTIPKFVPGVPVPFRASTYQGDSDNSLTRTKEGYAEVFEMATYDATHVVTVNGTHVNGVPKDCSKIDDTSAATPPLGPATGGLFGAVQIVNPAGGGSYSQNATALDNFYPGGVYFSTGSANPNYTLASPANSAVVVGGQLQVTSWAPFGEDAVTASLLTDSVLNEYILDANTLSRTEWIITHPTKYLYVNGSGAPFDPFTDAWNPDSSKACEPYTLSVWDTEERGLVAAGADFSPVPPAGKQTFCYEVNALGFRDSNIFGSNNYTTFLGFTFNRGWARIDFNGTTITSPHQMVGSPISATNMVTGQAGTTMSTFFGLPVIGFAAANYTNTALTINGTNYFANFAVDFEHRYNRRAAP